MNPVTRIVVPLLVISAMIFNSGCAETKDGRVTQVQGTAIGAVAGALIGGAIGAATGNRDLAIKLATVGAVVGGKKGYDWGTAVAKRKARYVRAEDWLDNEIALARQANQRAYAYNRTLKQRVAMLDRQVAAARASRNRAELRRLKGQISLATQQAQAQSKAEVNVVNEQKAVLGDAKARTASNYGNFQRESNSFNQARAERGQLLGRLASLDNSLDR